MTLRISTTKSIDKETSLLYLKEMGVILLMLVAFGIFWWIGYKERD